MGVFACSKKVFSLENLLRERAFTSQTVAFTNVQRERTQEMRELETQDTIIKKIDETLEIYLPDFISRLEIYYKELVDESANELLIVAKYA